MLKISIIVPVYGVEPYLRNCLDSILFQTYDQFEVILVDDESPDGCPAICDEYAERDARIRVIHKKNGGVSDARNEGLKAATGDYVLFVDSDDFWNDPTAVEQLVAAAERQPDTDLVFFRVKTIVHGQYFMPAPIDITKVEGKDKIEVLSYFSSQGDLMTSAYTKMIRRGLLVDNGIEFRKGLLSEDLDWSLDLYIHANRFAAIDNPFYCYRVRPGSITTTMKRKNFYDLLFVIDTWREKLPSIAIPEEEKRIYFGFLCYEYSILLGLLSRADKATRRELMPRLRKLTYLFRYDVNYKTRRVALLYRWFGFRATCRILQLYIKYRSKAY